MTQILLPQLNDGASIVHLSSLAGLNAFAGHSVYSATKAAVDALSRAFTAEFAHRKIRSNCVNPTVIMTEMSIRNWSDPEKADALKSRIPLRRFGELEEVVEPVVFLLSDSSSYINGHSLPIEGGFKAI